VTSAATPCLLQDVEDAISARVGPFAELVVKSGDQTGAQVEVLKSTLDLGGYDDLFLVRRTASVEADTIARVAYYDPPTGTLRADRTYQSAPVSGALLVLQHLDPALLRRIALAGLRRCFLEDTIALPAPPPPPTGSVWGAPTLVDLTALAFWLTTPGQVLAVVDATGTAVRGWAPIASRGAVLLAVPAGLRVEGLTVQAYRDATTLVNGADAPDGPTGWTDELAVPLEYAACLGAAEAWRLARDRLEAVAAEGRQPSQAECAAEATRAALRWAPFVFVAGGKRAGRIAPLTGLPGAYGPAGVGLTPDVVVNAPGG
jgi:hypothetical protein